MVKILAWLQVMSSLRGKPAPSRSAGLRTAGLASFGNESRSTRPAPLAGPLARASGCTLGPPPQPVLRRPGGQSARRGRLLCRSPPLLLAVPSARGSARNQRPPLLVSTAPSSSSRASSSRASSSRLGLKRLDAAPPTTRAVSRMGADASGSQASGNPATKREKGGGSGRRG